MPPARHIPVALIGLASACACLGATPSPTPAPSPAWRAAVGSRLLEVFDQTAQRSAATGSHSVSPQIRTDRAGRVQIDVHYNCSSASPAQRLAAAGFSPSTSIRLSPVCTMEGWLAPSALPRIAVIPGVTRADAPNYVLPRRPPAASAGGTTSQQLSSMPSQQASTAINGNGISIMRADQFVSQTGVRGASVTVGVQSTGIASLGLIQSRGELPAVQVVGSNGANVSGDEGTVLMEQIHAVAPAANLVFCDPTTYVEYLACLDALVDAGASILVDDLGFRPNDVMSSNSADAQAIEQILARNADILLFTAAGNSNGSYWEGTYTPVAVAAAGIAPLHCNTQSDNYIESFDGSAIQHLTVAASRVIPVALAWADPFGQNASNFDLYWSNDANSSQSGCLSASSASSTRIVQDLPLPAGNYTLRIATPDAALSGKLLKLWVGGDGLTTLSTATPGSLVAPQAFAAGVVLVGAINGSDAVGNTIEKFSSRGPLTVAFPAYQQLQAPTLVAPDGIRVDADGTEFEGDLFPDGNFYGTSAAVPNAGAIAVLLRSAFPHLNAIQLASALQAGATPLGSSAPDMIFGYGRIDALGALNTLAAPTITALPDAALSAGVTSPPMPFTVTGTGDLHFKVNSSDTAIVPASIVAAGTAGVTITPADCGVSTQSCNVFITPAYGGTAVITLSALDGANRAAASSLHMTISGAPPPVITPPPSTPISSPARGGGGSLTWREIMLLALLALYRRRRSA